MTIRKLKALLWILCLVALLGAGYTFYGIWQGKQEDRYTARAQTYFNDLIQSRTDEVQPNRTADRYDQSRVETLWTVNIIGKEEPKVDPTAAVEANQPRQPTVPPIDQVLNVGTIVWSEDPLDRMVKLTYSDQGAPTGLGNKVRGLWVSEGQALKPPYDEAPYNGRLVAIEEQTVRFQWAEGEQELNPGLGKDGDQPPLKDLNLPSEEDALAGLEELPEESLELEEGVWVMGTKDRETLAADPQKLLREDLQFRTIPPPKEGGRSSLELREVKPDSLPARYGMMSGDRIISVNGVPISSEASAINYYKQNPDLHSYQIVYTRRGAQRTLTIFNTKK